MKYLAVMVITLAVLVAADEGWKPITNNSELNKIDRMCFKESNLTEQQITMVSQLQHPDESEVHEFILCKVKAAGIFTEDNGYSADRLTAMLSAYTSPDRVQEIVTKCVDGNEQQSTPAVRAYRGYGCVVAIRMDQVARDLESVGYNDED